MLLLFSFSFVEFKKIPSCVFPSLDREISEARKRNMRSKVITVTEPYNSYFLDSICPVCLYDFTQTWDSDSLLTTKDTVQDV